MRPALEFAFGEIQSKITKRRSDSYTKTPSTVKIGQTIGPVATPSIPSIVEQNHIKSFAHGNSKFKVSKEHIVTFELSSIVPT